MRLYDHELLRRKPLDHLDFQEKDRLLRARPHLLHRMPIRERNLSRLQQTELRFRDYRPAIRASAEVRQEYAQNTLTHLLQPRLRPLFHASSVRSAR